MKVEELIIDGFKSYATRTVISGWDSSFNCITGLNGSGKSNILDAICFVLGITTMSTVRAQNLQDLIYKRGQAGVTKASVTIVFDNSDRSKSPIGFEDQAQISITRQIVLGGASKFLINGHRAQQQTIQALFQSVQLNINNPNFLIMQGRITKVLNMKPAEILALIEEAAGTRMFQDRREKAIKTMSKKEKKVDEILELLNEEIEPKLDNLRKEKRTFLEFQQAQSGLERLEKVVVAHDYLRLSEKRSSGEEVFNAKKVQLEETEAAIEKTKNELRNLEEEMKSLRKQREDQIQKGGRFKALEQKVKETEQEVARINTLMELKSNNTTEELAKKDELAATIEDLTNKIQRGSQDFEAAQNNYDTAKIKLEAMNDEYAKKEELLRSLQTGVSSKGDEGGYASQLQEARVTVNEAQTAIAQARVRVEHLNKTMKQDEAKLKKAHQEQQRLGNSLDKMKADRDQMHKQMEAAGWVPGKFEKLKERESELVRECKQLNGELEGMKRKMNNLEFNYSKPSPNFNPASVKGLVAQLFTLDKKNYKGATALEVCAGGRLYNVVVDTDETASKLLQHGKLRRRVTIIPLNQISAFKVSAEKLGAAQQIAPGKVDLALNLVGYEASITKAMEYVFGSTLICNDAESAKKVTFDPRVRIKTVTLDGDVYDPKGTLSGGSRADSGGMLVTIQKYNELNLRYKDKLGELQEVREELRVENELMTRCKDLKKQMDLKEHEIKLASEQLESGNAATVIASFEERTQEITKLEEQAVEDSKRVERGAAEVERIERDMAEFKNNKGGKLQQLKKSVETLEKKIEEQSADLRAKLELFQQAQVESGQATDDLNTYKDQLAELDSSIEELQAECKSLGEQYKKAQETASEAARVLDDERTALVGLDDELKEYEKTFNIKSKFATENGLACQKLKHEVEQLAKDVENGASHLQSLIQEYEWIGDQKQYFGKSGTPYDFRNVNMSEARSNLKRLQQRIKGMKNNVNSKVMNMIENVEKKEASLKTMIQTIERDKKKIEETILSLDEYKRDALVKTWTKVSEEFGKIFADLLPGGFAKLVPPEGQDVTEGLEVKVALGKVWKDSLAELSGGQRSLIALSLILALMQFKPAPMYILDEVDAALDLHHTQNVGLMIKNRFKNSQFIVVSLKDGLFQSANRIFRARFQDGTSTISVM